MKKKQFIVSITETKALKSLIIYENNILSIARDITTALTFFIFVLGFHINHKYCGGSYLLNLFLFIMITIFSIYFATTKKKKEMSKEDFIEYIKENL
jgi:hypothetical protein